MILLRLRELRHERRLSQKQMAEILGVKQTLISRYERGVNYPTIPRLYKIAESLKISPAELLVEKER
jgi:transcriptional regulator with XRE-family HTH domain